MFSIYLWYTMSLLRKSFRAGMQSQMASVRPSRPEVDGLSYILGLTPCALIWAVQKKSTGAHLRVYMASLMFTVVLKCDLRVICQNHFRKSISCPHFGKPCPRCHLNTPLNESFEPHFGPWKWILGHHLIVQQWSLWTPVCRCPHFTVVTRTGICGVKSRKTGPGHVHH